MSYEILEKAMDDGQYTKFFVVRRGKDILAVSAGDGKKSINTYTFKYKGALKHWFHNLNERCKGCFYLTFLERLSAPYKDDEYYPPYHTIEMPEEAGILTDKEYEKMSSKLELISEYGGWMGLSFGVFCEMQVKNGRTRLRLTDYGMVILDGLARSVQNAQKN